MVETHFSTTRRIAVVMPAGEIDLATEEAMRRALLDATSAERLVVVDLAQVTFMDSTGIGLLVAAAKRCRAKGTELQIVNATSQPLKVLRLTGIDQLVPIYTV